MSTDYKAMLESTSNHQPTVSGHVEPVVSVTKHATERFKERLGLPKRACLKQATKAFFYGFKHCDAKGKAKKYIDGVFLKYRKANNIRVHNGAVYIFIGRTLITVMALPKNLTGRFKSH